MNSQTSPPSTPSPADSPYAQFASHMDATRVQNFAGGEVAVFSRRSPDKTTTNEDAFAVLPVNEMAGVLVIADGCGGEANGFEAARRAIKAMSESVLKNNNADYIRASILDGFEAASHQVAEVGGGAATTLIVVEIAGNQMRTYHVGDSQAMLIGSRGKVKLQTRAHSPVGYALEAGFISEDDALEHEDRHLVSNVIGSPESHIEVGLPRPLSPRDTIVMGSDGLYDNLTVSEIVEYTRKRPLLDAAEATRIAVAERMLGTDPQLPCKPDDFTLILFRR